MDLVGDELAGDPMTDLRWVRRSLRKLQRALARKGHDLSHATIKRVLLAHQIRPKGCVKHLSPKRHPDRDKQFCYLTEQRKAFEAAGLPVVSVDTKKKELIGLFARPGQTWSERAAEAFSHDFPSQADAKAVPFGLYDPRANRGHVYVGLSGDTPDFAVEAIARWWGSEGRRRYRGAAKLLILADGGGSNGYRPRRWKWGLQVLLADAFGLAVTVCHFPPGASKWNPIEHRLFSQISNTWSGLPLTSVSFMLETIRATTTETGLCVTATLVEGHFPGKLKVPVQDWKSMNITFHGTCPKWNYTLAPRKNKNGRLLFYSP